jgi:hypothetical protein
MFNTFAFTFQNNEKSTEDEIMRGTRILIVFFVAFTVATLLIPAPMFPGNIICGFLGTKVQAYITFVSALVNGAIYGVSMWLVFLALGRKLSQ